MESNLVVTEAQLLEQTVVRLKQGWTKNAYAHDSRGVRVNPCSDGAVSWCLRGSMIRAFYDLTTCNPVKIVATNPVLTPLKNLRHAVACVVEELTGCLGDVSFNDEHALHAGEIIGIVERAGRRYLPGASDE